MAVTDIEAILDRHGRKAHRLVQILRETQDALGWLAPETLTALARGLDIPRAQVESTANFYSFFHTRPQGQFRILFADNITERMQGSQDLVRLP